MKRGATFGAPLLILATIGAGLSTDGLKPVVNPAVAPSGLEAQDTHAAASLLGQFRTSLSSWMFFHTDLYLHNGVEMRPLSDAEKAAGLRGVGGSEKKGDELHDDSAIVSVIPAPERDFRGLLGDVERATSAYRDMRGHKHNDPKTALPLFRLMTMLDPQFVAGWTTGAMVLSREKGEVGARKALVFLNEGLGNNPKSVELLGAIGKLHLTRFQRVDPDGTIHRDLAAARPWYVSALSIAWLNRARLSPEEREAALENARFAALLERDAGDPARLKEVLTQARELFPDDPILAHIASGHRREIPAPRRPLPARIRDVVRDLATGAAPGR